VFQTEFEIVTVATVSLGKFISADIQIGLNGLSTNLVIDYMKLTNPTFELNLSLKLGLKSRILFINKLIAHEIIKVA